MLNYNHLYYFHLAALEGSAAAAAQRMGVRQPTVSEQIRALEKTLGVDLFERTTAGLKLTEAGRSAFEYTSVMFRAGERLVEALGRDELEPPQALRVGMTGAVARSTTAAMLTPLIALDGSVPSIRTGDMAELIRDLRRSELDLVLCESEPPATSAHGVATKLVARTVLVAVAPPALQPDAEWQNVGLVHYRATSSYRWDVEGFLAQHSLRPKLAAESDDCWFLLEAAESGYVAFVPQRVARGAVAAGRLRALGSVEASHGGIYALYVGGATAELARRAVDVLVARAAAEQVS